MMRKAEKTNRDKVVIRSQGTEIWRRLTKNKGAMLGLGIIILLTVLACTVDLFIDYDTQIAAISSNRFVDPCAEYPFGTDNMGRDFFLRVIYGTKYSLFIGVACTVFSSAVGIFLGLMAGYYGGHIDNIIMRIIDIVQAIPAIMMGIADLKKAKMGVITGVAPDRVAYIRRYKMKDGSTMTCPPINDPMIDHPIGELDQQVHILRFDRENAESIVLVNYGLHADCLNLDQVSADWPGWMAETFETAYPGTKVMFLNGCEGDVGSTHVFPEAGDMNDTLISFDNEMKSPGMAKFIGRALAGTLLQVYDKAEFVDVDKVKVIRKTISTPSNKAEPKDLPLAKEYLLLHENGRDDKIPFSAMELTTVVAEARRMVRLENASDHYDLTLTGIKVGPVAFLGIPGEPFTDIGRQIKKADGWKCIMPMCLTNGSEGYFPMKDAFEEGGYEARASHFKGGVAEAIVEGGVRILNELK